MVDHPHRWSDQPHVPAAPAVQPPKFSRFERLVHRWIVGGPVWLAPLAILVCFAGAAVYVLVDEPIDRAGDVPSCLLKLTTGLDCPGCGGTRAFYFLLQGNVPAAARHHLLFVFAVPLLVYSYVAWATGRVFRWRLPRLQLTPLMVGVFFALLGVFTVLRNLPWEPFTYFYV